MTKKKNQTPPKTRKRIVLEWTAQLGLFVLVLFGVTAWQARNMVGRGEPAPGMVLRDLNGNRVSLSDSQGKTAVLYFFAPWCSVCHASSRNVNALRKLYPSSELAVYAVGLSYENVDELAQFAKKHQLSVPVLVGTQQTNIDYRISVFPSVYILNAEGEIAHRLTGYTTEWGLRAWTALTML